MNSKNIKRHLNAKLKDWLENIPDEKIRQVIKNNAIVTGGAMVSLLTGETVHDYDVYFRTFEACQQVAQYYVDMWNRLHPDSKQATLEVDETKRVKVFISSDGVVEEDVKNSTDPFEEFETSEATDEEKALERDVQDENPQKPKYRPVFLSSNAITLSDKVQVVIRFYGEIEEIHKNYDFVHCTCSWTSWDNQVQLPSKALEAIINKELVYVGSKYPLCSIIRTRKYLERGYHINAGQYVKMAFQLNELNLKDVKVLEDQLIGVDSGFFAMLIEAITDKQKRDETDTVDTAYVIELINRMF